MTSSNGNTIANQFIITYKSKFKNTESQIKTSQIDIFQSYDSIIAKKIYKGWNTEVILDKNTWDYSRTTGKYRNLFLGESRIETEKKIKSKEYKLMDLNK
tara:strand:- start:22013 stop:22312 length:300 start_codon:yes stop_codon:yes gene_type:complete